MKKSEWNLLDKVCTSNKRVPEPYTKASWKLVEKELLHPIMNKDLSGYFLIPSRKGHELRHYILTGNVEKARQLYHS